MNEIDFRDICEQIYYLTPRTPDEGSILYAKVGTSQGIFNVSQFDFCPILGMSKPLLQLRINGKYRIFELNDIIDIGWFCVGI